MAITKSAKKALRQNIRRRQMNLARKAVLKTAIKEYKKLISANKLKEAQVYLPQVYKRLDKAAKIKLIKKNTASRLKSRLTRKLVITK